MQSLLNRFRFQVSEIILIQYDLEIDPTDINNYLELSKLPANNFYLDEHTKTILNISLALKEYSTKSHVIMISLPVPKKNISDRQYMTNIDLLSCTGRPTFLVRGNQQTVLSIHS